MKTALPVACALAALLLFTLASGARGLWNPDEPREAQIAREMWMRGDPVVPHLNSLPFLEKPPLYAWLSGLAFRLRGGPDPEGARAASSCAGAALVGLTVRLALSAVAARDAALAGAALAGMPLFWWHASRANLDVLLALFVALAVAGFFRAWARSKTPGGPAGPYHHPALDAAAVCTALAILTKGLVGLALPVLIVAAFLAIERDLRFLLRLRWIRLCAFLAVPVLAWLVPFARRDAGALAHAMFVKHHLERYVSGFDHPGPWWHYLYTLPTSTLPWLPLALPAALDRRTISPLKSLALAWLLAPFLFFSVSMTKRDLYMVPSFPAIALLVALGGRGTRVASGVTGVMALAIAAALGPRTPDNVAAALGLARADQPWLMPLLIATWALCGLALILRGRPAVAALPSLLTAVLALGFVLPAVDGLKSARAILPVIAASEDLVGYQLREPDLGILTFPRRDPIWIASHAEDLPVLLAEGKRIVGSASVLMPALAGVAMKWREVASAPTGTDRFVVVERDPREAASAGLPKGRKVALTLRSMVH